MYIENIKNTLKSLDDDQYNEYLIKLRKNLKYKFNTDIKPSELKIQIENFLNNKTDKISIRYLEAYLLTLDDISLKGGLNAILHAKISTPNTWRDLLIISTEDRPLPNGIRIEHFDMTLIKEVKLLFTNVLKYCENEDKEELRHNIQKMNNFISIRKDLG